MQLHHLVYERGMGAMGLLIEGEERERRGEMEREGRVGDGRIVRREGR